MSRTIPTLLNLTASRASSQTPGYYFLRDGEASTDQLPYADLRHKAQALATRLMEQGASHGDRVLLLYPSGIDYIVAFFACLHIGAVAVPAYPPRRHRPDTRIQSIATDTGAKFILTTDAVMEERDEHIAHNPVLGGLRWLAAEKVWADEVTDSVLARREREVIPDTLAFLQYTSGSTGNPKGVMVSHANLLHNLKFMADLWPAREDGGLVTWLPIFHDMGLIFGILLPLYLDISCYIMAPAAFIQRPLRWLEAISRYRATHSAAPNFAYDLCVDKITPEQRDTLNLENWDMSLNGAEPTRRETFQRFAQYFAPCGLKPDVLRHGYGLAEATLVIAGARLGEPAIYHAVSSAALSREHKAVASEACVNDVRHFVGSGFPAADSRMLIVDPQDLMPCAPGKVGEIWLDSPSKAGGYWENPHSTRETFGARPKGMKGESSFLRTGDLGFVREDGMLFITGRLKDLIIIHGENYYPQDIEKVAEESHPSLQPGSCAAFSVEHGGEEQLVVVQEVKRTALKKLEPHEILQTIRRALIRRFELPVYAVVLVRPATILKTSSGKIQRKHCKQSFLDGTLSEVGQWLREEPDSGQGRADARGIGGGDSEIAADQIRERLIQALSRELAIPAEDLAPDRSFSDYGLSSLMAISLTRELSALSGRMVDPATPWRYPTIDTLTAYLANQCHPQEEGAVVAAVRWPEAQPRDRAFPLSLAQEALWFSHQNAPDAYKISSMPIRYRIQGGLDVERLKEALGILVVRHETLRSRFPEEDGAPVQRSDPNPDIRLVFEDIAQLDPAGQDQEIQRRIDSHRARRPLDLSDGPLWRVQLLRLGESRHLLVIHIHHIIMDAASMEIFIQELSQIYQGLESNRPATLPTLAYQYADFAHWQRAHYTHPLLEQRLAYYQELLTPPPPPLELPVQRPGAVPEMGDGGLVKFQVSPATREGLEALGMRTEATLFTILFAAYATLLRGLSGGEDMLIATPMNRRYTKGAERLIGYFSGQGMLRIKPSGDARFEQLVGQARDRVADALSQQDLTYGQVLAALRKKGHEQFLSSLPYQVGINLLPVSDEGFSNAAFKIRPIHDFPEHMRRHLALNLRYGGQGGLGLKGNFQYRSDLFEETMMQRIVTRFQAVLNTVIHHPHLTLQEIWKLTEEE